MTMDFYKIVAIVAFVLCLSMLTKQFLTLVAAGKPADYSKPSGSVQKGIRYSFTGAMSPFEKESAYLHFPTYIAGLIFHSGIFLSLFIFLIQTFFLNLIDYSIIAKLLSVILIAGALSGAGILIKRVTSRNLKAISGPDDYISNILTTATQAISAYLLITGKGYTIYFLLFSVLFLWIPIGKTRHLLYFFFARYYLGLFYGRRGTWPQKHTGNE